MSRKLNFIKPFNRQITWLGFYITGNCVSLKRSKTSNEWRLYNDFKILLIDVTFYLQHVQKLEINVLIKNLKIYYNRDHSYVKSVQVYYQKIFQLNQLIVLGFDVEQKPHTLNIQILRTEMYAIYYWQNYFTFITYRSYFTDLIHTYSFITRHFAIHISTNIYKNILRNGNTHMLREWFQHWISCDRIAQIKWISGSSNMLHISKIFLFRYIPNDKHDKWSVSLDYV